MSLVQSKFLKKAFICLLCLCFAFGSNVSTYAASTSELQSQKQKIQQQIEANEKKLKQLAANKKETEEYLSTLYKKVDLMKDKINNLQSEANTLQANIDSVQAQINATEAEIDETQRKIDEKQAAFDKTYNEYCQRLRAMYISGSVSNLEVLLTSKDLSSILTRSQMIKSVSEQDSDTLDFLMKQMEEIEKEKHSLEEKKIKLDEDKKKLEEDKKELDSRIAEVKTAKSELDSQVAECNSLMAKIARDSSEYKEAIENDEAKKAAVQRQLDQAYANASHGTGSISGSTGSGSGQLGYPSAYRTISAGYPYYSSGGWHGGVDFPCPSGTTIVAAASGTVITALNLDYSYGHYIIIDHGNGLSTLYAHNTTLYVSVGQKVSKGQAIAESGSTGNSTGPHCHFEVRVNGSQVNPMNYL